MVPHRDDLRWGGGMKKALMLVALAFLGYVLADMVIWFVGLK